MNSNKKVLASITASNTDLSTSIMSDNDLNRKVLQPLSRGPVEARPAKVSLEPFSVPDQVQEENNQSDIETEKMLALAEAEVESSEVLESLLAAEEKVLLAAENQIQPVRNDEISNETVDPTVSIPTEDRLKEKEFKDNAAIRQASKLYSQFIDKAFFASMKVTSSEEIRQFPITESLHRAILQKAPDFVSLEILTSVDNVGDKIASRDAAGRTALHIAALTPLSENAIQLLMSSYESNLRRQLDSELAVLMKEQLDCLSLCSSSFISNPKLPSRRRQDEVRKLVGDGQCDIETARKSIHDWFGTIELRLRRLCALKLEVWKLMMLTTRDRLGRTPLHLAAGNVRCSLASIDAIIHSGIYRNEELAQIPLSELTAPRNSPKTNFIAGKSIPELLKSKPVVRLFNQNSIYELATAQELGNVNSNFSQSRTIVVRNKSQLSYSDKLLLLGQDWDSESKLEHSSASNPLPTECRTRLNEILQPSMVVDFDVVIPWVLRNLVKSIESVARGKLTRSLELMLGEADNYQTGFLLLPELRYFLNRLGIRLTEDILVELCRRYPISGHQVEDALDKWERLKSDAKLADQLRAEAKCETRPSVQYKDTGKCSEKGYISSLYDSRDNDEKADFHPRNHIQADDKFDSKSSTNLTQVLTAKDSKQTCRVDEKLITLCSVDLECFSTEHIEDFGLNIQELINHIESGAALVSLYMEPLNENHGVSSNVAMKELLQRLGWDEDDDILQAVIEPGKPDAKISTKDDEMLGLPRAVTLADIQAARKKAINIPDSFGRTPLMIASALGRSQVVRLLLGSGADVSVCTSEGYSVLSLAQTNSVRKILEGELINWLSASHNHGTQRKKLRAVSQSLRDSDESRSHNLLTNSNSADVRSMAMSNIIGQLPILQEHRWAYSRPPLSWAIYNALDKVVRELVERGADVNEVDISGRAPLHHCVATVGQPGITEDVLKASIEIMKILMQAGADINIRTVSGRTPLHELFCKSQDDPSVSFRKIPGTNVGVLKQDDHNTHAVKVMLASFLEWGADIQLRDRFGWTPVHYCARNNLPQCLILFCTQKALIATKQQLPVSSGGSTILHVACKYGSWECVQLLAKWDADCVMGKSIWANRDLQGKTPLQIMQPVPKGVVVDDIWSCSRRGDASGVAELLNATKIAQRHPLRRQGTTLSSSISEITEEFKHRNLHDDHDNDHVINEREAWTNISVDNKTRRCRWTPLHSCIVGWAEWTCGLRKNLGNNSRKARIPSRFTTTTLIEALGCAGFANHSHSQQRISGAVTFQPCLYPETLIALTKSFAFIDSIDFHGRTPLHLASLGNLTEAITILLDSGADIAATDLDGNNCLHLAYAYSASSAIALLESRGCRDDLPNIFGKLPIECAGIAKKFTSIFNNE